MKYTSITDLYAIYQRHPLVFIDTRKKIQQGIFVAVGEKNDLGVHRGNQFAEQAIDSGQAAFAIINDPALKEKHLSDDRFLLVQDSEKTLQTLAQHHRNQLNATIIAIGGSNGKTTTKELLQLVLASKYKTFATQGNLNNHLGVPLSILSVDHSYEMVILEIGANHLEETYFLADLIQPDFGLVTNCGKDHLGEYGSIENIIKANKELYDVLAQTSKKAFVCQNDEQLMTMSSSVDRITYGRDTFPKANIVSSPFLSFDYHADTNSTIRIQSNLFGKFWLDTLLNAAAIGTYFGLSTPTIKKAIESYQPAALRSQLLSWQNNQVLLDCYNANPSSMEVFLEEIQTGSISTNKVLILGEMLELGEYSQTEHQLLVDKIDYNLFHKVIFVGASFDTVTLPTFENIIHFPTTTATQTYISSQQYQQHYLFVKGSRGNRLEIIFN